MKDTYVSPMIALVERAEELGWSCYTDPEDSSIEFTQSSPAGEDFSFCAYGSTVNEIVKSIREYANGFDVEEHIKMWLDAKESGTSGVPSVFELVEDAKAIQEMLDTLAYDGQLCGEKVFTLRKKIEEAKAWHMEHHGELNWQWVDEGLPNTIMDYHSSAGSVLDFTEDDWRVCKENDWTLAEVLELCDEKKFNPDVETLEHFFSCFPEDMPKEDAIAAVEDFYTWRCELLPIVEKVYHNG